MTSRRGQDLHRLVVRQLTKTEVSQWRRPEAVSRDRAFRRACINDENHMVRLNYSHPISEFLAGNTFTAIGEEIERVVVYCAV